MAFLEINGLTIPVADGGAVESVVEIGAGSRSFGGQHRDSRRALKRVFEIETIRMSEADAVQLEGLILGTGHHWDCESDLYSVVKGLGPDTGYSTSIVGTPKFGTNALQFTGANVITFDTQFAGDTTVSLWRNQDAAGYAHHVFVYDRNDHPGSSAEYVNDSESAGSTSSIVVNASSVTLTREAGTTVLFDDIVITPYKWTNALVTAVYNGGAGIEFSDLPRLNVGGDIYKNKSDDANDTIVMRGELKTEARSQAISSGSWSDKLRTVSFSLVEV